MGLYVAFIDLTKAFDTVSRDGLWKILSRLECPPKFPEMIRQLHEGQKGQVKQNGTLSDSFPISNGVEQGCVLAPFLFSIFFSMMLQEAKEEVLDAIYLFSFPPRRQSLQPSTAASPHQNRRAALHRTAVR